jgi:hypothetical protein
MGTQDIVETDRFCDRDRKPAKGKADRRQSPLSDFEAGRLDGARSKRRDPARSRDWLAGYDAGRAETKQRTANLRAFIEQKAREPEPSVEQHSLAQAAQVEAVRALARLQPGAVVHFECDMDPNGISWDWAPYCGADPRTVAAVSTPAAWALIPPDLRCDQCARVAG